LWLDQVLWWAPIPEVGGMHDEPISKRPSGFVPHQ
jgi:hypothetical protein